MVIAQLSIAPEEALALSRAHALAHTTSLDVIAAQVTSRRLEFTLTDSDGNETS